MSSSWPKRESAKGSVAPGYGTAWKASQWIDLLQPPGKVGTCTTQEKEAYLHCTEFKECFKKYPLVLNALVQKNTNHKALNEGVPTDPGIYEFAIYHPDNPDKRYKVYVGKAKNLHKRQLEYLEHKELHKMWPLFETALSAGNVITRRYATIGPKGNDLPAYQFETRFLAYFDYAYNGAVMGEESNGTNPPKRALQVHYGSFCCFGSSKTKEGPYEKHQCPN
jgi:hypothetical protein